MLHLLRSDDAHLDRELLLRLRGGDAEAFETLVARHLEALLDYAFRLVQSKETAEEVVQDIFAWVWEHRVSLDVHGPVHAYLRHAVRNRAFNHQRQARTQARREAEYARDDADVDTEVVHPIDRLAHNDLAAALHDAIDTLPERRRHIVLLRARHLSYLEIAEALGISVKTVEAQITRAFHTLRDRLKPWVE